MNRVIFFILVFILGCAGLQYLSMSPSEVLPEAEFYGTYKDGMVFIVKMIPEPAASTSAVVFWIINKGDEPIKLNFLADKIYYHIGKKKYIPDNFNTILQYPEYVNPGSYVRYGDIRAIRVQKAVMNDITEWSFKIGLKRKTYKIPRIK